MADTPRITGATDAITPGPKSVVGQSQNPPGQQLGAGTVLHGSVSGSDSGGNTIIKTDALKLVLKTDFPLKRGVEVTLRLEQSVQPQATSRVRITHINGQTAQQWQTTQEGATANIARTALPDSPLTGKASSMPENALPPVTQDVARPAPQAHTAQRPVGVLLEISTRSGETVKTSEPTVTNQPATAPTPRASATQVQITPTDARTMPAVLLRAEATPTIPKAVQAALPQAMAPSGLPANAMPRSSLPPTESWLKPGFQMMVRVISVQPPITPAQQGPISAPVSTAAPTVPTPTSTAPTVTSSPPQAKAAYATYAQTSGTGMAPPAASSTPSHISSQPATPGTQVPSNTVSSSTPTPPSSLSAAQVTQLLTQAAAQPSASNHIPAVVVGQEKSGAYVVHTQLGTFSLPVLPQQASTTGSVVQLEVQSVQLPDGRAATRLPLPMETGGAVANAAKLTGEYSALTELAHTLQHMQSTVAGQALHRIIPHIGQNMTAGMIFFLSVVKKGDISEWLGKDLMQQLEQMGKTDLISRLNADLGSLRTVWEQPAQTQGNWQALFFPVMAEKELHQARLFMKQDGSKEAEGGSGTRFVVELDLSNLGPMQLDGLVKKRAETQSFDLVIRTHQPLDDAIQKDVEAIFYDAQEAIGFSGKIYFRQEVEFPLHPLEEMQIDENPNGEHGSILA